MYAKPFIKKTQAESTLSKKNTLFLGGKKILKIDLVYLPVFLFSVRCEDSRGRVYDDKVSVDGIKGEFAFYKDVEFDSSPSDAKISADFRITESEALEVVRVAYSRYLYKSNMKTRNDAVIKYVNPEEKFYYPYWIGYYKRSNGLDFDVVDAIGGAKQGVKMRPVFIDMLIEAAK
jgi:hypothetical protein